MNNPIIDDLRIGYLASESEITREELIQLVAGTANVLSGIAVMTRDTRTRASLENISAKLVSFIDKRKD